VADDRRVRLALAITILGLAAAASSCGGSGPERSKAAATSGPRASCEDPSPIGDAPGDMGPEVQGHATDAELWGLIMAREFPLVAGPHEIKIVWRMTGSGPLKLAAYDAKGRELPLAWGPEEHGGSNYRRPGDEWGSGYHFRHPGCYRLTARRAQGRGEVWLAIGA